MVFRNHGEMPEASMRNSGGEEQPSIVPEEAKGHPSAVLHLAAVLAHVSQSLHEKMAHAKIQQSHKQGKHIWHILYGSGAVSFSHDCRLDPHLSG